MKTDPDDYWHDCAGARNQFIVREEIMRDWVHRWAWLKQSASYYRFLMTLHGFPTATVLDGISPTTTEPAPMVTLSPIVTPGRMVTLPPIHTLWPVGFPMDVESCIHIAPLLSPSTLLSDQGQRHNKPHLPASFLSLSYIMLYQFYRLLARQ